jgi:hypothetical protein
MGTNSRLNMNEPFSISSQTFEHFKQRMPELHASLAEPVTPFFLNTTLNFDEKLAQIFVFQYLLNPVYQKYCTALGWSADDYSRCFDELPPLLPVQAFKDAAVWTHDALVGDTEISTYLTHLKADAQPLEFLSSGTSAMQRSRHRVLNPTFYDASIRAAWQARFGRDNWIIWAYTPGYSENPQSSLLYMIDRLMEWDHTQESRYLSLEECLPLQQLNKLVGDGHRVMLFGAAFGWLDLIERHERENEPLSLPREVSIMETGGMKTFRRAISRVDLFERLVQGFNCAPEQLHTEYGMTECLSQAYTSKGLWLESPDWMKIVVVDPDQPNKVLESGQEGQIGIVDLANIYSCSFMLTGDRGVQDEEGRFQVLGRWEPTSLRGCNFLMEQDG